MNFQQRFLAVGMALLVLGTLALPTPATPRLRGHNLLTILSGGIKGKVIDPTSNQIAGARVTLFTSRGTQVAQVITTGEGNFEISGAPIGNYLLEIDAKGWSLQRLAVNVSESSDTDLTVQVSVAPVEDQVTVTASVGEALSTFEFPKDITIASEQELRQRPAVSLPQALREEPSVHVQQTTTSQGSVFLRGLTGQRVVSLIDGVRYNNSTFRPGPTQYLATVPLQSASSVEVVNGPASVQYGSDGLGGTINVLTSSPAFTIKNTEVHGQFGLLFGSADLSSGSNFKVSIGNNKISAVLGGLFTRANDVRPGDNIDSRSVVTRFFGISSKVLGDRLQDTAFTQYGGEARIFFKPSVDQQISFHYLRSDIRGNRRYDQLNGGNGNLLQGFEPQTLDFIYTRYQKQQLGFIDNLTGTFSFNRQRDDRQSQSGDSRSNITREFNRTDVFGYSLIGSSHIGRNNTVIIGADFYDEVVESQAFNTNPVSNVVSTIRGRFPDNSRYRTYGFYAEDTLALFNNKVRLNGGVRYGATTFKTRAKDDPIIGGRPVGLDASTRQDDVTFNFGASVTPINNLSFYGAINRGFRTPNVNDLGSIGITSNGFSITAAQAAMLNADIGDGAGANARTTGIKVGALNPETALNYEGGVKVRTNRLDFSFGGFLSDLDDVTVVRSIIVPTNVVGQSIGGQTIISQSSTGTIFVAGSPQPVIARVNAGEVRFTGLNATARIKINNDFTVSGNTFYLKSRDKNPPPIAPPTPGVINIRKAPDAPDFEGGLPPFTGLISIKYQPQGKRYWAEVYSTLAGEQDQLSSVDLNDQRIGATRSRANIATFFNAGARARGLIGSGTDGRLGTADDTLLATGETLTQIQDRVLGRGINSAPLFLKTAGYGTLNFRGGFRMGENSDITFILENVLDKNYRIHGSGTDAAGVNFAFRYQFRF
jgi:hemoglobin/transferrin/lactoferrin receptor protein